MFTWVYWLLDIYARARDRKPLTTGEVTFLRSIDAVLGTVFVALLTSVGSYIQTLRTGQSIDWLTIGTIAFGAFANGVYLINKGGIVAVPAPPSVPDVPDAPTLAAPEFPAWLSHNAPVGSGEPNLSLSAAQPSGNTTPNVQNGVAGS